MSIARRITDPYNKKNKRNEHNTKIENYNCGGYAFGIFSWLHCNTDRKPLDYYGCENAYQRKKVRDDCIAHLLRTVPNIRIVRRDETLDPDEYLVAFRMSTRDFHFIRQMPDGSWWQKSGGTEIRPFEGNPFGREWKRRDGAPSYRYKVTLFAVKER